MEGFKKCDNGHFFRKHLDQCPYCRGNQNSSSDRTTSTENIPTQMNFGGAASSFSETGTVNDNFGDRTKVFGGSAGAASAGGKDTLHVGSSDYDVNDKTFIGGFTPKSDDKDASSAGTSGSGSKENAPRSTRKIVGWLISYTIDPMGMDYRIYEGNNPIGRETSNSIILMKDPTISGKHLNILFKQGKYWAKDEMSANGSFINEEEMEISKPYEIKDGDVLRLGDTVFKFKSSL
jgi:hypothetical protein